MAFEKPFSVMNAIFDLRERTRHVVPADESDKHETDGGQCACDYRNEWIKCADGKQGLVVIHSRFDPAERGKGDE